MKILRPVMLLAMVAIITIGIVTSADAAFKLRLTEIGGGSVVFTDDGPGDASPIAGVLNVSSSLGSWLVNISVGISKPVIGGPNNAVMDLNSVNVTSDGPSTIMIELTDTDFSLPISPVYNLVTRVGGTTNGIFSLEKYYDVENSEFGGALVHSFGPVDPGAFSATLFDTVTAPPGGFFSMTDVVYITHSQGGLITSFDAENNAAIPEPGTLMLLGSGLLGIAGYARVKSGRKK